MGDVSEPRVRFRLQLLSMLRPQGETIEAKLDYLRELERGMLEIGGRTASAGDSTSPESLDVEPPARLGERLVAAGVITPGELAQALEVQRRSGERLGQILLAGGTITDERLARVLADQWGMPYLGTEQVEVAPSALPAEVAWQLGVVPVVHDGEIAFATASELDEPELARLRAEAGTERLVIAAGQRVKELLTEAYRDEGADAASNLLRRRHPNSSASTVVTTGQKLAAGLGLAALAAGLWLAPILTCIVVLAIASIYYGVHLLYRIKIAVDSLSGAGDIPVSDHEVIALDERELPPYTILVPLYKEAEVVELITRNIRRLDYPAAKLEVLLLCEEDDEETIGALERADLPGNYHVIEVPAGEPRTKPRACNYGLLLARGEYCVIYDAEDRPDPDQLKRVVAAFRKSRERLACVQARLNYFNARQNLLTAWFAAEYAMWFDLVLPGLHFNGHPVPLGGTSNHFRTDVLRELCAWDPFNVTEDADLGVRLWERGYATAMIDSVTLEEANSRVGNWIRQRSRWIKGYIQTWLVHMRHPVRLAREIGAGPFVSVQLTIGGILVTLFNPIFWALAILALVVDPPWLGELFPGPLLYLAVFELVIGNFVQLYLFLVGLGRRGLWELVPAMLLLPVYWVLMSIAGWKGALQLVTRPFYWEKTDHGLVDADAYLDVEPAGEAHERVAGVLAEVGS